MNQRLDLYEADREQLLGALSRRHIRCRVPARLVHEAILECGWSIQRLSGMRSALLGLCCAEERAIQIPTDFRQRLRVPATARLVYHETLAHELAHIRLHAQTMLMQRLKDSAWENEADVYARVFLVPRAQLLGKPAMQRLLDAQSQQELWRNILCLAQEFCVTGWFLSSALELYGFIRMQKKRRLVEVLPVAHELVGRFVLAWSA